MGALKCVPSSEKKRIEMSGTAGVYINDLHISHIVNTYEQKYIRYL